MGADDDEKVRKRKRRWWFGSGQVKRGVRSWEVELVQLQTLSGANHYAAWKPGRRAGVLSATVKLCLV